MKQALDMVMPRNGENKIDWFAYIRTTWPALVLLGSCLFWLGARLETPEQKETRIRTVIGPIHSELERLRGAFDVHVAAPGHAVILDRFSVVSDQTQNTSNKIDLLDDKMHDIERQLERIAVILERTVNVKPTDNASPITGQ